MAGNHFSITFDAKMNVGQVKGAISEMKKGLEQLKLPPELEKGMGNNLTKLANEMKRFEDLSSKPMKNPSDFKALERSGDKIFQLYNRIRREASEAANMSPKNMEKFFPASITTNIEKATAALEKYKAAQSAIEDLRKARVKATEEEVMKTSSYTKAAAALEKKRQREKDIQAEIEHRGSDDSTKNRNFLKSYNLDKLRQELTKTKTEAKDLEKELNNIKVSELKNAQTDVTNLINKLKELGIEIDNIDNADQLNLDNFYNALKNIEGIDINKIPKTLEGMTKAVEGLKGNAANQFLNNLRQMSSTVENSGGAFDNLQEDIRRTGQAVEDADARFRDVSAFKSRISMFLSFGTAMRTLQRAVRSSFETIKELDATMTETAVVTDFSVGDMWKQLPKYTKMANELGVTTNDAYKAATLYYQQGLSTNQVMAVSNETLKMARIAGIDAADATDYMTAALRGFNMEINEVSAQRVNDVYSKLAAETASDTEELSIAMSKTASIASNANMEFENTAALLAQIIETTREAPETAGTAMKTIIARFSEVKELFSQGQLMGSDEEGEEININKIDAALKGVGISLKSFLRGDVGLDDILLELASKWDTLDLATQRYIATTAAGSRQQSRFLAMMSNYSRTVELTDKAYNAAGAGQEQYEKTLDSMETALNRLKNAWDQFAMGIANSSLVKGSINSLTTLLGLVNQLGDGLGGFSKSIVNLGLAFGGFQIGRGAFDIFTSFSKGNRTLGELQTNAGKTLFTFSKIFKDFRKERDINEKMTGKKGFFAPFLASFTQSFSKADTAAALEKIKKSRPDLDEHAQRYYAQEAKRRYDREGTEGLKKFEEEQRIEGLSELGLEEDANNMDRLSAKMQILGAASSVAGVGLMKVSDALENAGHSNAAEVFDTIGKSLLGLGTTLTTVGMALPGLTKAFPQLGTAITKMLSGIKGAGFAGMLPMLAAVAAAIVAIKVAMEAMKAEKALSLEGQLESTEKAIQRAREEAQQAKDAYDELLESKTSYNEVQKGMEGLVKGTRAWSESLVEANSQVMGLVDKAPGLAEYLEVGKQGQLSISDEGWTYLQDYGQKAVRNSQYALISHQLKQQDLLERKTLRDFAKETIGWREGNSNKTWGSGLVTDYTPGGEDYYELFSGENFAKIYSGTRDNPTAEMKKASQALNMTIDEMYDSQGAFAKLSADMAGYHSTQVGLAKSMLSSTASQEALGYKFSDQLFTGLAEHMTSFEYDDQITAAAHEIANVNGDAFKELADEYGVSYKMGNGGQKDLETLYAAMKNIDVEAVSEAGLSQNELSKEIATMANGAVKTEALDGLTKAMKSMDEEAQRQVASLLSGNISDLTSAEIAKMDTSVLGEKLRKALTKAGLDADEVMQQLGYDSLNSFVGSWDKKTIEENYKKNVGDTLLKINQYSKNKKDAQSLFVDFEAEQRRFREMGLEYQSMVNGIFNSLESSGNDDVIAAGWQAFSDAVNKGATADQIKQMSDWVQEIDWSNPIEGAYALNEAANSGNEQIQNIAKSMDEVSGSTFDAATQMDYFLNSDFESIKEDLKDIVDAGGEITGTDIRGLAKNYKNLDKMLKNTGMSANALGKTLTLLNKGDITEKQLTAPVLAAIRSYEGLNDIAGKTLESIGNFDAGIDESQVNQFMQSANEAISGLLSSGYAGNSQIGNYLDYLFGADWDANVTNGQEYTQRVQQLNSILGQNTQNMSAMWDQFLSGYSATGEYIGTDKLSFGLTDTGAFRVEAGTTSQDMIDQLVSQGFATQEMAQMALTDYKNRNPDFMLKQNEADYRAGLKDAISDFSTEGGLFSMDDSEVAAIAAVFGKSVEQVKEDLKANNNQIRFTDLYDETGSLEDINKVLQEMGKASGYTDDDPMNIFSGKKEKGGLPGGLPNTLEAGRSAGQKYLEGFKEVTKDGKEVVNYDKIRAEAKKFRLSPEDTAQFTQSVVQSFQTGAEQGQETFVKYMSAFGEERTVKIPVGVEVEEAIEADKQLAIEEQKSTIKVGAEIDSSSIAAAKAEIETIGEENVTAKVTAEAETKAAEGVLKSLTKARTASIKAVAKTGGVAAQLDALAKPRTVDFTVRMHLSTSAKGVKNSVKDYMSLTGEEGPELHQTKNGAYITGANGPAIDYVNKGDTIYTASETKKIMRGNKNIKMMPRYIKGKTAEGVGPGGDYETSSPGSGGTSSSKSSNKSPSTTSNKAASNSKKTADNTKKAAEDAEKWENSFDHLYNLTQDINAELRTREKLEKQYQRYLKERIPIGKTLAQISKSELYSLEQQRKLQERMLEARKHDIVATEEEYKDYNQYAHYNWQDQTIEIDWDKINGVTDKDQGEKIEKYIDKLEEIQDQIQEAEDAIDKIYDDIQEIRERGEKANEDLQDKVLDALIDREQKKIDLQEETNRAINDAANDLHDAISRNIEKMRQDRENEKTKEDLAEKERRLAYLRMDTTGGNALEIKQLEKEIKEQREQFNDDLVDQALNNMQEQNEEAADQRQRQIDLLQGVLDFQTKIGYFATRALEIVNAGTKDGIMTKDSELHQLLVDENEDYWEKSVGSRNRYLSDIAKLIAEKYEYDEFIESERNLKNGGYMTQMMNATSAEEFRQAEEARNTYVNNHPEEGYATTGFSQAYKQGQINSIGYNEEDIFGKKDENGFLIAGTGINWQAEIDKAIKNQDWERAAMMEGYRDLKISKLAANDPARASAKMTYGSQAATAYANATGSKTASGAYGKAKYQPASHGDLLLLDKAKSKYNSEYSGATETPGSGGYMDLMQKAVADGNFDLAYYYARLRDEKTSTTGKDYGEPDAFQYVYDIEKGYGSNLEKAQNYYQKGFDKGYTDGEDYMSLINNELGKSKPNWGQAFTYAGQRDNKLQNDPNAKQYSNGKEKETWNYVFKKWPKKFKTGGLVEGTGLAWLDGTPSRPEYVLNAGQTQAFLRLSDMVGNLTSGSNQQITGDTYINVDINVDQIANDYDVERAAEKVKQIIYQDSMYRNVNRINFLK